MHFTGSVAAAALVVAIIIAVGIYSLRGAPALGRNRALIPTIGLVGLVASALFAHYRADAARQAAASALKDQLQTRAHWDDVTLRDAEEFCLRQRHLQASQPNSATNGQDDEAAVEQCRANAAAQTGVSKDASLADEAATKSASASYWDAASQPFLRGASLTLAIMLLMLALRGKNPEPRS